MKKTQILLTTPPHNKYIKWADTAWFRKNILEIYVSKPNHSIDLDM